MNKGIYENVQLRKKLDTIEDPHGKHTIEDQGSSWATLLEHCLSAVFHSVLAKGSLKV